MYVIRLKVNKLSIYVIMNWKNTNKEKKYDENLMKNIENFYTN